MPPRNSNREERSPVSLTVPDSDTFCTITLEGHPEYTEKIYDAIMAVAEPRLKIGRGSGQLEPSRTPGLVGVRYLSLVIHKSDLTE